jgi:hypothetical protein
MSVNQSLMNGLQVLFLEINKFLNKKNISEDQIFLILFYLEEVINEFKVEEEKELRFFQAKWLEISEKIEKKIDKNYFKTKEKCFEEKFNQILVNENLYKEAKSLGDATGAIFTTLLYLGKNG